MCSVLDAAFVVVVVVAGGRTHVVQLNERANHAGAKSALLARGNVEGHPVVKDA